MKKKERKLPEAGVRSEVVSRKSRTMQNHGQISHSSRCTGVDSEGTGPHTFQKRQNEQGWPFLWSNDPATFKQIRLFIPYSVGKTETTGEKASWPVLDPPLKSLMVS